jgi:Protein of unknown function (DUF3999)
MSIIWRVIAIALLAGSSISYFKYERPVQLSGSGQQFIAVDETVWRHARADLGDLRLYAGSTEVPYSLISERGTLEQQLKDVPVLQQSTVAGKAQFLIDMSGLAEYDHVNLKLSSRNFVAHAKVEGADDLHAQSWAALSDSILYDLSRENLGGSSMLRLPRTTYKYLRVTIDGPVKPAEVQGATSELREEHPPVWREVGSTPREEQKGKETIFTFDVPEKVPAEKVHFEVAPTQSNFRRQVEIRNEKDEWLGSGEINRIHMVRSGQKIDSEDDDVTFSENGQKAIKIIIHNGDDSPLKVTSAQVEQLERRLYFQTPLAGEVKLYYGDEKLERPVYDYAKLFLRKKAATAAQVGPEAANSAFSARPDDRPWSERHPVVLWVAIVGAVVVLGTIALRSMRTA